MNRIAEINTGQMAVFNGNVTIRTSGIGSCLAIVLYDDKNKIGGMAHAMLPSKSAPANNDVVDKARQNIIIGAMEAKYVDDAIDLLISKIEEFGGKKENLKAKLAGGAKMFQILSGDNTGVGFRNIEMAKKHLADLGIMVESEETGGTAGRTAELDLSNGLVNVTTKM